MSKLEKISWLAKNFLYTNPVEVINEFAGFWYDNVEAQKQFENFSENTLTNFHMPFSVAPNFLINGHEYCIPMVIEESSVVAAASNAAKFWMERGGFKSTTLSTIKVGQVHFFYKGNNHALLNYFESRKNELIQSLASFTTNMQNRGGGIVSMELLDMTAEEPNYYQIQMKFETCDSMGANFINSVLEQTGAIWKNWVENSEDSNVKAALDINMCILSNYTPECLVRCEVSCKVSELGNFGEGMNAEVFADKFAKALRIAEIDPYRATTHNKGIQNGVDAVVIATGNDFRAVESCIHTYASRSGKYSSLSHAKIEGDIFKFWMEIPLALGTVGGLTKLHPLAKTSLEMLGNPSASKLMEITAAVGLAQNFAAVKSLITTGIQKGHMKMHLSNIISQLSATVEEANHIESHFSDKTISVSAVRDFLMALRHKSLALNKAIK